MGTSQKLVLTEAQALALRDNLKKAAVGDILAKMMPPGISTPPPIPRDEVRGFVEAAQQLSTKLTDREWVAFMVDRKLPANSGLPADRAELLLKLLGA